MVHKEIFKNTEQWIQKKFSGDATGHDVWHIKRVVQLADKIAREEQADIFICQMAAYLHDIPDEKLTDDIDAAKQEVLSFLDDQGISDDKIDAIWKAIKDVSFKGNHTTPETVEGRVVQDADRLDAIGAIGIARTFAYGGNKGSKMYEPQTDEQHEHLAYRDSNKTTIYHFYEKLLKLKDLMNTETAKSIAESRHQFMEDFLQQFYTEWKGDDC
ncbi:HD domain-containing protein [Salinibacillus xinjiangensis]|nr:HD domain-containing protein [Salinibacillus xinjiangensis]